MVRRKRQEQPDYLVPAELRPGSDFMRRDVYGWLEARRNWYQEQGEDVRRVITPLDWLRENRAARGLRTG